LTNDHSQRPHQSNETIECTGQSRDASAGASHQANDPLTELGRLIGQTANRGAGSAHESDLSAADACQVDQNEYYDGLPPPRRRVVVALVATMFGLAGLGTTGAFGYRAFFGSGNPPVIQADKSPLKGVPDNSGGQGGKAIADRLAEQSERIASREEKPVDITQPTQAGLPNSGLPSTPPLASEGNGLVAGGPNKVHTIMIRPDGSSGGAVAMASPIPPEASAPQAAPPMASPTAQAQPQPVQAPQQAAAPSNAPLSVNPDAAPVPAQAVRTASAGPAASHASAPARRATAFAVQIASQRSEADAKDAYRAITKKYPRVLKGKNMFVYSVNLGPKGTYYRAMVGPYSVASEAGKVCSSLKSAGGSCIIQRNP
jgi:sporulation related protein